MVDIIGTASHADFADGRDLAFIGDHCFVGGSTGSTGALGIVDVSDPAAPAFTTLETQTTEFGRGVAAAGDSHVLLSGRDSGSLVSVDVSDPSAPAVASEVVDATLEGARGVWHDGDGTAYLAVGYYGSSSHTNEAFVSFDVSDPANISQLDYISTADVDRGGNVLGAPNGAGLVYMTGYRENTLMTFDASDPAALSLANKSSFTEVESARDLSLSADGETMYLSGAGGGGSLSALDVSDPAAPSYVAQAAGGSLDGARGNDRIGDTVYVGARAIDSLAAVDVSDPAAPEVLGAESAASLGEAYGVAAREGDVYCASASTGDLTIAEGLGAGGWAYGSPRVTTADGPAAAEPMVYRGGGWVAADHRVQTGATHDDVSGGGADYLPASAAHHYDATQISASDGDVVSTWADLEGSLDLTGGDAVYRASGLNGNPSVEFATGDEYTPGEDVGISQPNTWFIVIDAFGNIADPRPVTGPDGLASQYVYSTDVGNEWNLYAGGSLQSLSTSYTSGVYTTIVDGSNSEMRFNSADTASPGDPGAENVAGMHVGGASANDYEHDGHICEIILCDDAVQASAAQDVESALMDKWGVTA